MAGGESMEVPLTPLEFARRSRTLYPDREAVVEKTHTSDNRRESRVGSGYAELRAPQAGRRPRGTIDAARHPPGDSSFSIHISAYLRNDQYWPDGSAVGRRFRLSASSPWSVVVGVAANVECRAMDAKTFVHVYYPWDKTAPATPPPAGPRPRGYAKRVFLIRAADPDAVMSAIKPAIWGVDKNQPIERIARVEEVYADRFGEQRFVLQVMSAFGALAAVLTAVGIFGVLSQIVGRRTREIGVRIALGARPADVLRLVIARGAVFTLAGIAAGAGGALALTRFLESLLFEVRPVDPVSFFAAAVAIVLIALAACWLPARRAVRVDPVVALRVE